MKISIALDRKSKVYAELPVGKANQLYKQLAEILIRNIDVETCKVTEGLDKLIDRLSTSSKESFQERFKKVAEETGKSIEEESIPISKPEPLIVSVDTPVTLDAPAIRGEIYKGGDVKKNLVMIKCEKCGHVAVPTLFMKNRELIHKEHSLICRECGEELPQIREINHAKYNCPNCSTNANFYVSNGLKEVTCKECGSPIDLVWHEKRGIYISANLLERGDK